MLRMLSVTLGPDGVRASAIAYGKILQVLGHGAGGRVPDDVDRDVSSAILHVAETGVFDPDRLIQRALARMRKTARARAHAHAVADAFVRGDDRPQRMPRALPSGIQTPLEPTQLSASAPNGAPPAKTVDNIEVFLCAHAVLKAFNEACALAPPPLSQKKRDFLAHSISVLAGAGETEVARLRNKALAELRAVRD